jgi:hypothetical protein
MQHRRTANNDQTTKQNSSAHDHQQSFSESSFVRLCISFRIPFFAGCHVHFKFRFNRSKTGRSSSFNFRAPHQATPSSNPRSPLSFLFQAALPTTCAPPVPAAPDANAASVLLLLARLDRVHHPLRRQQAHLPQRLPNRSDPRRRHRCRQHIVKPQHRAILRHAQPAPSSPRTTPSAVKSSKASTAVKGRPEASMRRAQSNPPSKPEVGSTRLGS